VRSSAFACAAAAWIGLAGAVAAYARETAASASAQAPQQAPAQSSTPPATNQNPQPPAAAGPISYSITGIVHTGKSALPGVTVTASNTLTGKKVTTTTALDGTFSFSLSDRGRYVVRAEFLAFAPQTQEVLLNPQNQKANVDLDLSLASRVLELQQEQQAARAAAGNVGARRGFQTLAATPDLSDLNAQNANPSADLTGNGFGANAADLSALPFAGAGTETATESVVSTGALGQSQNFGGGSEAQIQQRIDEFRQSFGGGAPGGFGGGQFGGGGFGGPGGGGIIGRAVGARGFNINQPHGALYFSDDNAGPDAAPFSVNGAPVQKAAYNQAHFGALVGGPLNIPKIYHGGTKTFFFVNYNGTRASTPYDQFSTVPTMAEREGDFAGITSKGQPVSIYAPASFVPPAGCPIAPGQQFSALVNGVLALNAIPAACISAAAATATAALLPFIPTPNVDIPGSPLNFHYVTAGQSDTDSINVRLIHNFGAGFLPQSGGRGGGGGGRRRQGQNINFVLNYSRTNNQTIGAFPSLNGTSGTQGLNAGAGYSYNKGKLFSLLRFNYNHLHTSASNLYAFVDDIEKAAGITGVATDAFDWGLPILNFSDLQGVTDPSGRRVLNQTYTLSETFGWSHKKHTFRFGGDYRRILESLRSDQNARGSFTFTGFATASQTVPGSGFDFADFLLGLPELTSIQSGTTAYNFRSNSYDVFAQDEWKIFSNFTVNMGVRYEYQGPFTEANNHIVNLDVLLDLPSSLQAAPVLPGAVGPYTGITYPDSLIEPDRNDFAPRIGLAWRALKRLVVRAGYGWNYNLAQYSAIIQNLAFQPPFAITATNTVAACPGITLTDGFSSCTPPSVTNNYAVDPNYRLGYIQLWNLDTQTDLGHNVIMNVGYNGSKGTHLDLVEAPNRTPSGVVNSAVQPFLFETSEGNSNYNGLSIRVRKRLQGGIAVSGVYVYSKSIDDASSIGGGAVVVAQNSANIAAERGLSSFDQRHKFTGTWIYELPFGNGKKYLQSGPGAHILGGWLWSGDWTFATGTPLTPRIIGAFSEVNSGTSGTLRPDLVPGQSISVPNPSIHEWFNTAAFCDQDLPTSGCYSTTPTYGDAGRNIIPGPGQILFDMSISKTIQFREQRTLEFRATANNVFNHVNFANVDTNLNSPTYGQVISVGTMRRVTFLARFRF